MKSRKDGFLEFLQKEAELREEVEESARDVAEETEGLQRHARYLDEVTPQLEERLLEIRRSLADRQDVLALHDKNAEGKSRPYVEWWAKRNDPDDGYEDDEPLIQRELRKESDDLHDYALESREWCIAQGDKALNVVMDYHGQPKFKDFKRKFKSKLDKKTMAAIENGTGVYFVEEDEFGHDAVWVGQIRDRVAFVTVLSKHLKDALKGLEYSLIERVPDQNFNDLSPLVYDLSECGLLSHPRASAGYDENGITITYLTSPGVTADGDRVCHEVTKTFVVGVPGASNAPVGPDFWKDPHIR